MSAHAHQIEIGEVTSKISSHVPCAGVQTLRRFEHDFLDLQTQDVQGALPQVSNALPTSGKDQKLKCDLKCDCLQPLKPQPQYSSGK